MPIDGATGLSRDSSDQLITPGQVPQGRVPVRVRQCPSVEHEVRIVRHAVPISERLEQERRPGLRAVDHASPDQFAQFVHRQSRGIDRQVGRIGERRQQALFLLQGFHESHAMASERMPAPRFAEALEQRLAIGAQEQRLARDAALAQRLDQPRHLGEILRAIARVDADGRLAVRGFAGADGVGDESGQQACRDVVDAIEIEVLQHVERDALAGARQPADHDQSHVTSPPLRGTPASPDCRRIQGLPSG